MTSALMPSAALHARMLDTVNSMLSAVPVLSRKAYIFLSAGANSLVCPMIEQPFSKTTFLKASLLKSVL